MKGSIEKRGRAWRVRIDAGRDPVTGRRKQLTRTVNGTKREAQEVLARLLVEVGDGRHEGTASVTFGELCERWLEHALPNVEPNTGREFVGVVQRYLGPLRAIPLRKLRAWDLDRFYAQLLAGGGRGGRPLSPSTVGKVHTVVRLALAQAVRWQWVATNVAVHASPPTIPRRDSTPPSPDQARALVAAAGELDPEWAAYLRVAAALGARRGEVCALRWSAVDLDAGTVAIQRAVVVAAGGPVDREYPKNASSRRKVAIDPGTVAVLAAHRRRQAERALAVGTALPKDAYVFAADVAGSRPWNPQVVTHRFERLRRRLGFEGVRLHDLRHYVATQLIAAGVDVRTVAGRLGHANANVTLSTYAAWMPARDQEAASLVGAMLDGGPAAQWASGEG